MTCTTGVPHVEVTELTTEQDQTFLNMYEGETLLAQLHGYGVATSQSWSGDTARLQYTSPGSPGQLQCAVTRPTTLQANPGGYMYCSNQNTAAIVQEMTAASDQEGLDLCRQACDDIQCETFTYYPATSAVASYRNRCYLYPSGDCGELEAYQDTAGYGASTYTTEMCNGCLVQHPCVVNSCDACVGADGTCHRGGAYGSAEVCESRAGHYWCPTARYDTASTETTSSLNIQGTSSSLQIRIRGGGPRGVLELNIDDGGWGAVCDDNFDQDANAATAFCQELGYYSGTSYDALHGATMSFAAGKLAACLNNPTLRVAAVCSSSVSKLPLTHLGLVCRRHLLSSRGRGYFGVSNVHTSVQSQLWRERDNWYRVHRPWQSQAPYYV